MKLSELLERCKLEIPNMNQNGMKDSQITRLLNQACDQVNLLTKVYAGYTDFAVTAEKQIYNLSESVPLYLGRDKRGLYFKDANNKWHPVTPKTEAWFRRVHSDYLNGTSAAIPQYCWIDGDELGFYQNPSVTSTARLYHLKKSTDMSSNDHYPFTGTTSQITAFIPLDDALIAYARWKISPSFGPVTDQDLRQRDFVNECRKGAKQIKRKPDLTHDYGNRMYV